MRAEKSLETLLSFLLSSSLTHVSCVRAIFSAPIVGVACACRATMFDEEKNRSLTTTVSVRHGRPFPAGWGSSVQAGQLCCACNVCTTCAVRAMRSCCPSLGLSSLLGEYTGINLLVKQLQATSAKCVCTNDALLITLLRHEWGPKRCGPFPRQHFVDVSIYNIHEVFGGQCVMYNIGGSYRGFTAARSFW